MQHKSLGIGLCIAITLLLAVPAMAQGGALMAAEFGLPGARVDVTPQVRSLTHDGVLQFEVTRQVLGVDPAPGRQKDLIIRIRHWDGDVQAYSFPERSFVNLEVDPDRPWEWHERGLHIMRAYYGGEGHFVNVTDRVRSFVDGGHLFMRIDNEHIGVDPDPHVHKVLRVLYWFEGERRNIVVPEKAELRLP